MGTGALALLVLRRDRVRLPLWVLALVGLTYASAQAVGAAYPTQRAIDAYADSLGSSPSAIAMSGPPVALHTRAGVVANEVMFTAVVGIALLVLFLVVRHTRAEEEEGRAELLRSAEVGRHAGAAAAMAVALLASVVVGLGIAGAMASAEVPVPGALLFGASITALGAVFASIALCLAQVFTHARTTLGAGLAVLAAVYVLRAAGDVRGDWLVWLSPIGWSQATHAVGEARWWPLLVSAAAALILLAGAAVLAEHRDVGAGLYQSRPGPAVAARWLGGPISLAFRLHRGALLGWTGGMFLLAAMTGSLTREMQQMAEGNPQLQEYLRSSGSASLTDSFFSSMFVILALMSAAYAVSSTLRLRAEETSGRLELLLATGLSRRRWMLSSLLVTGLGSVLVLAASGLGMGLAYGVVVSDPGQALRMAALALVYAPAVLSLAGVAALLVGCAPTWSKAAWGMLTLCFVLGWLGGLLNPPRWLEQLSPFAHTPLVPSQELGSGNLTALALLVVLLCIAGVTGFRRRDVTGA